MDYQKRRLQEGIKRKLDQQGRRLKGRPFTVAIIGTVGVGKSSLINTIATAMSTGPWQEHAVTGHHGTRAEPVTAYTRRFPRCCREEEHKDVLLPTLLDIGGLPDQLDQTWQEVIELVLYGRVPEGENLLDVHEYIMERGKLRLPRYFWDHDHLKVDRVIVVASATEELPENLLNIVVNAARPLQGPNRRAIPIFGVMTKVDLVDPVNDVAFQQKEEKFQEILGLLGAGNRYKQCTNYCTAIDPWNERIHRNYPTLDVPVLELMTQICDPVIDVDNRQQRYPFYTLLRENCFVLLIFFCGLLMAFFLARFYGI